MSPLLRRAAGACGLLLFVACSDTTAPDPVFGTYQLKQVDGAALPVKIFDQTYPGNQRLQEWVTKGTLTVEGNGRFSLSYGDSSLFTPGPGMGPSSPSFTTLQYAGKYSRNGSSFVFTDTLGAATVVMPSTWDSRQTMNVKLYDETLTFVK